jgi:hypothetical protein
LPVDFGFLVVSMGLSCFCLFLIVTITYGGAGTLKKPGTYEGEEKTTTGDFYWHIGTKDTIEGWYPADTYFENIVKPAAVDLNLMREGKSQGDVFFDFVWGGYRSYSHAGGKDYRYGSALKLTPYQKDLFVKKNFSYVF